MSAHTPGPWTPEYNHATHGWDVFAADDSPHANPGEEKIVAGYISDANARLIAAAPELLAIAKLLALATDEGDDMAQGTHYVDARGVIRCKGSFLDSIEKARAAIAKAEGAT